MWYEYVNLIGTLMVIAGLLNLLHNGCLPWREAIPTWFAACITVLGLALIVGAHIIR
jgi:hypothetical protein